MLLSPPAAQGSGGGNTGTTAVHGENVRVSDCRERRTCVCAILADATVADEVTPRHNILPKQLIFARFFNADLVNLFFFILA